MSKGKATTLLTIVSVIMAIWLALTFARFPLGIKNYNSVIGAIDLDYDVAGGVSYELTYDKENENTEVEDVNEVIDTLSKRMDILGYKAYKISAFKDATKDIKDYSIRISAKKTDTVDADVKAVAAYGTIKFYGGAESDPTTEILSEEKAVKSAKYTGQSGENFVTAVEFTDYAFKELKTAISENDTFYLKITLGDQTLLSGQLSSDGLTNNTIYITTNSEANARQTAMQISTGGLDYRYNVSDSVAVEPVYGKNAALYAGLILGVLLILIIAAMLTIFGGFGVISSLSMLFFALLETIMLVAVPNVSVSLAGFIGIGVATVLAADGLVITIKRVREEFAVGKTVKAAIKSGYKRAFMPTLGINLITAIVAVITFAFTGGAFNAFAITLGIGAVVSFIANVLISRMFVSLILPLCKDKEKFLNLKREENV